MPIRSVPFETFGGLDLRDAPDESSCIDCLNVDLDQRGRLRSRDGYAAFTSIAGTNGYDSVFTHKLSLGTNFEVLAGAGNRLEAISSGGVVTANSVAPTASPHNFTAFGDATTNYVYIANGTDQIRRWDGAAFTAPAGLAAQVGRYLAVTPWDNRLVHAQTTNNKSRVSFSDAGVAETFGANNWIDIRPGDGQAIMAMVTWRDLLFVFKQTYFAVFYSTSTDSSGNPIFNYRLMDGGAGAIDQGGAVAAADGVYFRARDGIYRTNGGSATCVSDRIEPYFRNAALPFYGGGTNLLTSRSQASVPATIGRRVYFPLGGVLVYDIDTSDWLVWSFVHTNVSYFAAAPDATAGEPDGLLSASLSPKHIYRLKPASSGIASLSTDAGTAITSRYRQGFWTPDSQQAQAVVREMILEGTGTVTVKGSTDWGSLGTGQAVTLGTSPAIAENRYRIAQRGRHHSYEFSGTTPWSLQRVEALVRDRRPVTAK